MIHTEADDAPSASAMSAAPAPPARFITPSPVMARFAPCPSETAGHPSLALSCAPLLTSSVTVRPAETVSGITSGCKEPSRLKLFKMTMQFCSATMRISPFVSDPEISYVASAESARTPVVPS